MTHQMIDLGAGAVPSLSVQTLIVGSGAAGLQQRIFTKRDSTTSHF